MPVSRKQIVRACKGRGWQIQPDALQSVQVYLQRCHKIDSELLETLAEYIVTSKKRTLTADIWQQFLKDEEAITGGTTTTMTTTAVGGTSNTKPSSSVAATSWSDVQVISAFRDVRLSYHTMKKHFQVEEQPWSLFGKAEEKVRHCCFDSRERERSVEP